MNESRSRYPSRYSWVLLGTHSSGFITAWKVYVTPTLRVWRYHVIILVRKEGPEPDQDTTREVVIRVRDEGPALDRCESIGAGLSLAEMAVRKQYFGLLGPLLANQPVLARPPPLGTLSTLSTLRLRYP